MRTFVTLAAAGTAAVVLFKLLAAVVLPLVGLAFGLLLLTVKLALVAAVAFFLYSAIRRRKERCAAPEGGAAR